MVPGSTEGRAIGPVLVRIAAGLAAVALLLLAERMPIWVAQFSAPQYPDGLDLTAYGNRVEGDMGEILELSHYIGMRPFDVVDMPEMRFWLPVILLGTAAAVLAVVATRPWLRRVACAAVWLIPVGALADVQFRLWQSGHGLDSAAAIRMDPFTPLAIGRTTQMNFTIWAYPGSALLLIALAAALVTLTPFFARRLTRR